MSKCLTVCEAHIKRSAALNARAVGEWREGKDFMGIRNEEREQSKEGTHFILFGEAHYAADLG